MHKNYNKFTRIIFVLAALAVLTACGGGGSADNNFDPGTNAPIGAAPVASAISPAAFNEDTQSVITLTYTDAESDQASVCALTNLTNVTVTQACTCTAGTCTVGVTGTNNYNGAASFDYVVTANSQTSNTVAASLTINSIDDAPVANAITPATFNEEIQSVIALSYTDTEGDLASACALSNLTNVSITQACVCTAGTCTVGVTGGNNYFGAASFDFSVIANSQNSNTTTASLTIANVNDAPVAAAISPVAFNEDTQSVITLSYTDLESDPASSCALSGLTNVSITQACACSSSTCTVGVTGTNNYNGAASFNYTVTANSQTSNSAAATLSITGIDDAPVAVAITPAAFNEDVQSVITLSYSDVESNQATACNVSGLTNVALTQACACLSGTCTVGVTGTSNYNGAASFNYTVTANSQNSNTVAASLTINAISDAPVTAAITPALFNEDTQSIVTLSYTDADGDPASSCALSGLTNVTETLVCACSSGICKVGITGTFNYAGAASFNYTVTANGQVSNASAATLGITNVNDPPVANAISPSAFNEDTQSVITLSYLDQDSDPASSCALTGLTNVTVTQACACTSGTCTVGVTGTNNYNGAASFNYTVIANSQTSNSAAASLTINNVDDAPVAVAISPAAFNEDTQSVITLSYSDVEGNQATACGLSDLTNVTVTQACACSSGTCTVGVTGTSNYSGAASFNYTVTANSQSSNSVAASLTINNVNDAPVAAAISPTAFNEDTQSIITLSYTDLENDQASSCALSGLTNVSITQACACSSGTCTVGVTGTSNYSGAASFNYTVTANSQTSNSAAATLSITGIDDAPVAAAITPAAFNEDTQSVITLSYTDADADQATACGLSNLTNVTVTQACACSGGTCTVGVTGTSNYNGAASFNYTVVANSQTSNSAAATLTINALNDPPVASAITPAAFNEDTQSVITLSYTDSDGDLATACTPSSLTNVTVTQACACTGGGVCTVGVTGTANYFGAASFNYTVTANGQTSNTVAATLSITQLADDAFTMSLPFTTAANYTYTAASTEVTAGVARLIAADQLDDSNDATGFTGGTHLGTAWDVGNAWVELADAGGCNATLTNCSELDASWTPQYASIVGYWKMNGTVTDEKGSNNCTIVDGGGAAPSYPTAKLSQGIRMDGANDYLNCGTSTSHDLNVGAWGGWFKLNTTASIQRLLIKRQGGNYAYELFFIAADNTFRGTVRVGAASHLATGSAVPAIANKWYHVMANYDGATLIVYVNGVQAGSQTSPAGNIDTNNTGTLAWGADPISPTSFTFNGDMDDVAVWNVSLSATEIKQIYNRQRAKYAGSFTSRVMDAGTSPGAAATWTGFNWAPTLPFSKELPDAGANETTGNYASLTNSTLMNNIVGLWHLNETSWNGTANEVVDDSGNGNHGTRVGNATTTSLAALGSFAGTFDGAGDYVTIADSASLDITTNITLSVWVKKRTLGAREILTGKGNGVGASTTSYYVEVDASNQVAFTVTDSTPSGNKLTATDLIISDTNWHHIVGTYDGATQRLYLDGKVSAVSNTWANTIHTTSQTFAIGRLGDLNNLYLTGELDEVAIWSRALDANEVRQLYQRGANRIKYQVRSCNDNACAGETWDGPDGAIGTYFSEQHNNSNIDADNDGSNEPDGNVQTALPTLTFNDFTLNGGGGQLAMTNNRYFQYRTILESDDENTLCNSGAATCSPELTSITVNPLHYVTTKPNVVNKAALEQAYLTLTGFTETGVACTGGIQYQLSADTGTNWYYYDTGANPGPAGWKQNNSNNFTLTNTATEMNTNAATFENTAGAGTLWVKAFLNSNGAQSCQVNQLDVTGMR